MGIDHESTLSLLLGRIVGLAVFLGSWNFGAGISYYNGHRLSLAMTHHHHCAVHSRLVFIQPEEADARTASYNDHVSIALGVDIHIITSSSFSSSAAITRTWKHGSESIQAQCEQTLSCGRLAIEYRKFLYVRTSSVRSECPASMRQKGLYQAPLWAFHEDVALDFSSGYGRRCGTMQSL